MAFFYIWIGGVKVVICVPFDTGTIRVTKYSDCMQICNHCIIGLSNATICVVGVIMKDN